jgi:hypothetical protein
MKQTSKLKKGNKSLGFNWNIKDFDNVGNEFKKH